VKKSQQAAVEQVAGVTTRLAVLLSAGVAPASAWEHLAARDGAPPTVQAAARAALAGDNVASAIDRAAAREPQTAQAAWRALGAAWSVAIETGAPLAECLRDIAGALRECAQTERDLAVALAGPAATARMVAALPLVGLLFGFALGFDIVHTLLATVPGLVCLGAGSGLMLLAYLWNRRMVRRATPRDPTPGLVVDLTAVAMAGGGSAERATALVADAAARFGVHASGLEVVADVLELSRAAGAPASELLRSEAEQVRRQARTDGQRTAATLAVRLMLPLAVCIMPAFMLLSVVPLMMSILSSTFTGW
jgi:tight adherence protein B